MAKKKQEIKKEPLYVRICPKCRSHETTLYKDGGIASTGAIAHSYECLDCGYVGRLFPEIEVSKLKDVKDEFEKLKDAHKEILDDIKNSPKVDATYGKFAWKVELSVLGLFMLLGGFILFYMNRNNLFGPVVAIGGILIIIFALKKFR